MSVEKSFQIASSSALPDSACSCSLDDAATTLDEVAEELEDEPLDSFLLEDFFDEESFFTYLCCFLVVCALSS